MTKEELLKAIAGMSDDERAAILGAVTKDNKYRVVPTLRLYFGAKPNKEMREEMSSLGFHWNGFEKFWFAEVNEKTVGFATKHGFKEEK